ncbi:MAG: hypothetical protein CR217_12340 [Beijerinckiaceae bacterium]|nr:MAG: hypothetical protein CR217_12340 [Beijerinckiaceae bacterium]
MAGKRYAGDVCGDPRTLHAGHAGKEALFLGRRDLLTLSFSRSVTPETSRRRRSRAQNSSKHQNRRPKRRHPAQLGVGAPCAAKRAENPPWTNARALAKNPSRIWANLTSEPWVRPCQPMMLTL